MIKGVGKRIVLLNNTDSELFEQAIFILKTNEKIRHEDVVKECERMMRIHIHEDLRLNNERFWKGMWFAAFGVSAILLALAIIFVVI